MEGPRAQCKTLKNRGHRHTQGSQLKASRAIPEEKEPEIEYAL